MPLSYQKYQKIKAALADNTKDFSDEVRAELQAAVDGYGNDYATRAAGVQKDDHLAGSPLAMPAEASGEAPVISVKGQSQRRPTFSAPQAAPNPDEARVQQVVGQLDPGLSLPAQALALQPTTTHPGGDDAAADEWVHGDLNNPNGVVVAYEMPVDEARKKLLQDPQLFRALQLEVPPTPEGVMSIQTGDTTHQALNDYYFREAAKVAGESGKTIYRRAKAPWLGDGKNAGVLDTLATKLSTTPISAPQAFILGVDDTAYFGVNRATSNSSSLGWGGTLSPEDQAAFNEKYKPKPTGPTPPLIASNRENVTLGGEPEPVSNQERNDRLEESEPGMYALGQVAGAVPGVIGGAARGVASLGKKAINAVRGQAGVAAATVATKGPQWNLSDMLWDRITSGAPSKTLLGGAASGLAKHTAAGAADQTAREGVQAASNYVETGETGTALADAGQRIAGAAVAPAFLGALGGGLRGLGNQLTEGVEWGRRYGGAPGRVKAHGVEPTMFKGHVPPPVVKEAQMRGRMEGGRDSLTVLASDLDEPLADAVNVRASEAERVALERTDAHFDSPEGGHTLPMRNAVEEAASQLRKLTSEVPRRGRVPVARGRVQGPIVDIFNANIEGVSARPTKNGVKLTAKEARSFLAENWTKKLDLDKLEEAGKPVYVTPRRYDSVGAEEFIAELRKSKDPHVVAVHDAAINDRGARGGGKWAKEKGDLDRSVDEARAATERVGSTKPGGVRETVEAVGKSKGQHAATPALRDAARAAGGDNPERLRGALIAEDLDNLDEWSSLGNRNPLSNPWNLWGLTDKAILKTAYPAARKLEKTKPGAASAAARAAEVPARNALDDRGDDRRKKRNEKQAEGYRERAKGAGAGKREPRKERVVKPRQQKDERATR